MAHDLAKIHADSSITAVISIDGDAILLTGPFRTPNPADIITCFDCGLFHAVYVTSSARIDRSPHDDLHFLCSPCAHALWPESATPFARA